jgi:hypothetical protein
MAKEFEEGDYSANNLRENQKLLAKYGGTESVNGEARDWREHDVVSCLIENGQVII